MTLESLDGLKHNLITNITVERTGEMIDIQMNEVLPSKSLWKASTLAYGCESNTALTELSKY